MQVIGSMFLVVALTAGSLAGGWYTAWDQHRQLTRFRSVQATITTSETKWLGRTKYTAAVEYRYHVNAQTYTGTRLAPLQISGDKSWARQLVDDMAQGSSVTAYYDPAKPQRAYLVKQSVFWPYLLILAPAFVIAVYLKPLAVGGFFRNAPTTTLTEPGGWYRIASAGSTGGRLLWHLGGAVLWYGYGLFAVLHYRQVHIPPLDPLIITSFVIYGAVGLLPVVVAWRLTRRAARLRPALVLTTLAEPHVDKPIIARVEQIVNDDAMVAEMNLSLVCDQRWGLYSHRLFSMSATIAQKQELRRNQLLADEATFEVPPKKHRPSSLFNRWHYPRIDWQLEVSIKLQHGPTYRSSFPIRMHRPEAA